MSQRPRLESRFLGAIEGSLASAPEQSCLLRYCGFEPLSLAALPSSMPAEQGWGTKPFKQLVDTKKLSLSKSSKSVAQSFTLNSDLQPVSQVLCFFVQSM